MRKGIECEAVQTTSERLTALHRSPAYDNVFWMAAACDRDVLCGDREEHDPIERLGLQPIQETHLNARRYAHGRRGAAPELLDEATDLLIEDGVDFCPSWGREGNSYADHADAVIRA